MLAARVGLTRDGHLPKGATGCRPLLCGPDRRTMIAGNRAGVPSHHLGVTRAWHCSRLPAARDMAGPAGLVASTERISKT